MIVLNFYISIITLIVKPLYIIIILLCANYIIQLCIENAYSCIVIQHIIFIASLSIVMLLSNNAILCIITA